MSAGFAIDTNIAIYAFSTDQRRIIALELLKGEPKISMQLLNEFAAVSLRKRHAPWPEIIEALDLIDRLAASVRALSFDVHHAARSLAQRYKLSFYDALMLAAALLDECEKFYSEDMQHGMVIDGLLTITNPFMEIA